MITKKQLFANAFLEEIKTELFKEKNRLMSELDKFARKTNLDADDFEADFPEYGDEEEDNAREVADYTTNKQLEETLEKELRDVDKALVRINEGTYGVCKYCERPIDEKRLLARPTSGACVSCKKTITDEA